METMGRRVIIWASAVAILLSVSCGGTKPPPPIIPAAAITGDNSGGAIAFYQTWRMSGNHSLVDFYAQRISPEGDFLWGERGILIASGYAPFYWACDLYAVSDGSGGAIVIWEEPLPEPPYSQTHVAKIDSEGNVEWQRDKPSAKEAIKEAIPDGAGGVIIAYIDGNGNMSVLNIDAEGSLPWGEDGVSLNLGDCYLSDIASDNLGGVIVVRHLANISAQRVDSGGNITWQTGGVQVCVGPAEEPRVVSDGSGGAIIAYTRDIPCGDGKQGNCDLDIYAQRIGAEGDVLWGSDGVPICVEPSVQHSPGIVDDGAGGAIIFFVDDGRPGVWAQRIDANGYKLWPEDVPFWESGHLSVVSDGFGGAIRVEYWEYDEGMDARVHRLDAAGRELWGPGGTTLTLRDLLQLQAAPDGCGGVLISWSAVKFTGYKVSKVSYYVQRVDAEGNVMWGDEGILLNP